MVEDVIDRSQVEAFLKTAIETMGSGETRELLKDSSSGRPGPRIAELQQGVWESMGVPTAVGRTAVSRMESNWPGECNDLLELRGQFGKAADAAYIQCLEDRKPASLKKKGKMTRDVVLEFFDASCVRLDSPDVVERLRSHVAAEGSMPEPIVDEVHGEVMELLGFERGHGQRCFEEMGKRGDLAQDQEVAMSCARWRGKTSGVCLRLLAEHARAGGELRVDDETRRKLLEMRAREDLEATTEETRTSLLERHAKKVNVLRALPPEGRARHLDKLAEEERRELIMTELLMAALSQKMGESGAAVREE